MFKISKLTDYGTVVMAHLARDPERVHSASEVAASTHVALPTVSKILKMLAMDNLVASSRGARGGYRLARDPEDISIADIIQAMEGPVALTACASDDGECEQEPYCSIATNWRRINETVIGALRNLSLAEMVRTMDRRSIEVTMVRRERVYPDA
jgi:FeS assembly SUF system regulator